MANYRTNEQSLLSYLEEQLSQTESQYIKEVEVYGYWASGEYKKDSSNFGVMTNEQIDFFMTNTQNRMKPLMFRMKWLESQINEIKSFNS
jgi:hypothetical protein